MRMPPRSVSVSSLAIMFTLAVVVFTARRHGQEPTTPPTQTPPAGGGQDRPLGGRPDQTSEPRPYDRVITKDAKSDDGIFTVHTIKEKIYYEIPKGELNKEFLWVS